MTETRESIEFAQESTRHLPRLIVLEGDPAQMGLRHGQALKDEIRFLIGQIDRFVFRRIGRLRGAGLRVVARVLAGSMDRHIPDRYRREMRATACGAGVAYSDILLMNALDDVLNVVRRLAPRPAQRLACSSFAISGPRTWDGSLMHGRNLDYHFGGTPIDDGGQVARLLLRHTVLFGYRPAGGAAFLSLAWPGFSGVTTALNVEGISLGNLTSYVSRTTPGGVPSALLYRSVIEEAATIGQAAGILRGARRTIGNNLMVGSGSENSAALFEITRDVVAEVAPRDGMLVATNHFVTPELAQRQRPYLLPHSVARWRRLRDLASRDGATVEEAIGYLADTECEGGNPFARVANDGNAVSVLFRPARMEVWVGLSTEPPASRGEFRPVDASALLSGSRDTQSLTA